MNAIIKPTLAAAALLLVSSIPQATASHATRPELGSFQAELAYAIARQGNEAVARIRDEARRNAALARPTSLSNLAVMATELAADEAR